MRQLRRLTPLLIRSCPKPVSASGNRSQDRGIWCLCIVGTGPRWLDPYLKLGGDERIERVEDVVNVGDKNPGGDCRY